MHHNIILRFAMGLTALLIVLSLGFAWGVRGREQRFAAREPVHESVYTETQAAAAYRERCAGCHPRHEPAAWAARQPAPAREASVLSLLQQHGKASEAENRLIARYLAQQASGS